MSPLSSGSPRIRLAFLDGVRGWSALYVVVVHACYGAFVGDKPSGAWGIFNEAFSYGRQLGVSTFIVLSGFCLMLPVAADPDRLRGWTSWWGYLTRRFRRIVPTYLAALGLSLALLAVLPAWMTRHGWANSFWPAFEIDIVLSHLLLVHNLSNDWISRINPPFWSVATEWQIYFLFPLLLLVIRRWGWPTAVATGFALGLGVIFVFRRFETAAPWFLGLFALGMASAHLAVARDGVSRRCRRWLGHPAAVSIGLLAVVVTAVTVKGMDGLSGWKQHFILESAAGVACASGLLWLCGREALRPGGEPRREGLCRAVANFFAQRPAMWLGEVSYSLYLTHALAIMVATPLVARLGLKGSAHTVSHLLSVLGLSLLLAWLFYLSFERPFVSSRAGRREASSLATPGRALGASSRIESTTSRE